MALRNREGSPIDPVPFIVVTGLGFMLLLSFGPLYVQALGGSLPTALAASASVWVVVTVVAYHRYVWAARPNTADVPSSIRAERLFYAMVALGVIIVGLAIPLIR